MTADRDTTRVVRSWLRTDEHESADRVLETVLSRLDTTPQRRRMLPSRRLAQMNTQLKLLIAAAAVVVVAVVGYQLLPRTGFVGGQPTTAPPTPTPVATPAPQAPTAGPTATLPAIPPAGALAIGRHPLTLEGVPFTFEIAQTGWVSNGAFGFDKDPIRGATGASFIYWEHDADGVFTDPCGDVEAPPVGRSAAAIAATIGGKPAQYVAIMIPDVIDCAPNHFYLWYDSSLPDNARYATDTGSTIRVWIIEVDGKRVQLDGETYKGAGPEIGDELQAIIDSITFG